MRTITFFFLEIEKDQESDTIQRESKRIKKGSVNILNKTSFLEHLINLMIFLDLTRIPNEM